MPARPPNLEKIVKNRIKRALLAGILSFGAVLGQSGAALALPTPPSGATAANTAQTRTLGYLWQNSAAGGTWTGAHEAIQWQDLGPCDYAGYQMQLAYVPSNSLHAGSVGLWTQHLSAVMRVSSLDASCNFVIMYGLSGIFNSVMKVCGQGWLSVRFVGAGCNDRVVRIDFVHR
jgi:hypothetical protein